MPTYTYRCLKCGHEFERFQSMSDDPVKRCEKCKSKVQRVFHPVGIVLKGSGFYKTDNRSSGKTSSSSESKASEKTSDSKSDTTSEPKSESKSDSKSDSKKSDGSSGSKSPPSGGNKGPSSSKSPDA